MNSYKINSLKVMGEPHPTYGYTYWGYMHDIDMPVRFSSKLIIDDIKDKGRTLIAEEKEVRQSSNGKDYLQLKKVKFETSGTQEHEVPIPSTQPFKAQPRPAAAAPDNKYYRDITTTCIQIYNGSLHYAKDVGLNLVDNKEDLRKYLEYVQGVTNELMDWIEHARNDKE